MLVGFLEGFHTFNGLVEVLCLNLTAAGQPCQAVSFRLATGLV